MAHVIIESDDGRTRIEVRQDVAWTEYEHVAEGDAVGWCEQHQEWLTDRGHFEDTCEAIANHLDTRH